MTSVCECRKCGALIKNIELHGKFHEIKNMDKWKEDHAAYWYVVEMRWTLDE